MRQHEFFNSRPKIKLCFRMNAFHRWLFIVTLLKWLRVWPTEFASLHLSSANFSRTSLLSSTLFAADFFPLQSQFAPSSTSTPYSYLAVPLTVKAVNQLVDAPDKSHALLECIVEVFFKTLNDWYRNNGKVVVYIVRYFLSSGRVVVAVSIFFSSLEFPFRV